MFYGELTLMSDGLCLSAAGCWETHFLIVGLREPFTLKNYSFALMFSMFIFRTKKFLLTRTFFFAQTFSILPWKSLRIIFFA